MPWYIYVGNRNPQDGTSQLILRDANEVIRTINLGQGIELTLAQLDVIDNSYVFEEGEPGEDGPELIDYEYVVVRSDGVLLSQSSLDPVPVLQAHAASWAAVPDLLIFGDIQLDDDGVLETASVIWPDGATGLFTTTEVNAEFLTVDAYTITRVVGPSTSHYLQPTMTRNEDGVVIDRPAIIVS